MKVAIVHDFLQSMGGAERVTLALSEMFPDALIYTLTYNPALNPYFQGKKIVVSNLQRYSFLPAKFLLPFYALAVEQFDLSDFDVVISSSHSFVKNIITPATTLHIAYIHSPMRYIWDTWHSYLKQQRLGRAVERTMRNILSKIRIWDRLGSSRVDVFVANSKNVRNRIRKYYRRDALVVYPPVDTDRLRHLIADREHRIQRGHRFLEDHGDPIPAQTAHLLFRHLQQVLTLEPDAPGRDPSGWTRHQPKDGQGGDRLAAPRFTYETDRLAPRDGQIDSIHRPGRARGGPESCPKALNLEQGIRVRLQTLLPPVSDDAGPVPRHTGRVQCDE